VTVSTTTENIPTCANSKPHVISNSVSSSESEWTELRRKNLEAKLPKNTFRCLKQSIPHIPPGDNRFEPLSNLREDTYQPTYNQHKSQPAQSSKTKGKNQRKVILLGDSHIRGCSEKLADLLGNSYNVIGITKPNANVKAVTDSINLKTEQLTKKDVVILCGGTRDISKYEANIGLQHISQFANSAADTNMIVMCAPSRYDLQPSSCVNMEVASFNRKLHKSMKIFSHVQARRMSTNHDHYTTHGFHMNT